MIAFFAACSTVFLLFAAFELLLGSGHRVERFLRRISRIELPLKGPHRTLGGILDSFGAARRLRRAGVAHVVSTSRLILAKAASGGIGLFAGGGVVAAAGGGRMALLVGLAVPVVFFLGPDAVLEMMGRKRLRKIERELSDTLDLAATGIGSGENPLRALARSSSRKGALGIELGVTSAEVSCGVNRRDVLAGLEERIPSPEIAMLAATIERSARFGSPLADRFRQQAAEVRRSRQRRILDQAARSSPRIQLVVALLLVPSVLLMIAAGLLSNMESFLSGL